MLTLEMKALTLQLDVNRCCGSEVAVLSMVRGI